MSTWVPSLPLAPGGFPIPNPGLGLLGPLIGGAVPVVANVLGAAIVSELLFPRTVADGTLDGNWRQVWRDWGTENFVAPEPLVKSNWDELAGGGTVTHEGWGLIQAWFTRIQERQINTCTPPFDSVQSGTDVYEFELPVWAYGTAISTVYSPMSITKGCIGDSVFGTASVRTRIWDGDDLVRDETYEITENVPWGRQGNRTTYWQLRDLVLPDSWPDGVQIEQPVLEREGSRNLDGFRTPDAGAIPLTDTGAPTLTEQVADAIAGAGVAVAAPPSPQLPGSTPVGVPGGGGSSSPEGQQVTGTGVTGGSAPLAPAPLPPAPLPAPVLPGPAPLAPGTAPALPGTPTEAPPAGAPALPGSQPLDNTGNPVPPTLAPPGVTPPGQETTPLGPVGGPGQQPAPTLQGIAAEVGKIEQKVLQLQRELQSPPGTGQLVPPWALPLLEALFSLGDGVNYSIPQPCGVDADGNPEPPVTITVPGALDQFQVIKNRIDGLAELIAVHKEIRQPVCVPTRAEGQGVTVTFEQVPGG